MGTPDERIADLADPAGDPLEAARVERAAAAERMTWEFRRQRARLRETAAAVTATETAVAKTFHARAERARRAGRLDDARRLDGESAAALRAAQHERQREVALRERDDAAQLRDDAARDRDDAAQRRDEAARQRDDCAVDRAVAAGRRRTAADDRQTEEEQWPNRVDAMGRVLQPADEQSAVDAQVRATLRGLDESHRQRAVADRQAEMDDRAAADRDRRAAAEDREIARIDREAAARDRAAAQADREQAAIDRETGH
jgi:colicin import membrane protein